MIGLTSAIPSRLRTLRDGSVAVLLGVGAILVNAIALTVPSIWADEGATLSAAQRTWDELWKLLHNIDAVHGTYYTALKLWLDTVGADSLTLRVPSTLAAGALVSLTFMLGREWVTRGPALFAAATCALLPRTTWMAIEGRSWAFGAVWATLSTLLLTRWNRQSRLWVLSLYSGVTMLGIATNIYIAFLVPAHLISLLLIRTRPRQLLTWGVAAGAAVAASSPIVLAAAAQRGQLGDRGALSLADWLSGFLVKQYALGDTPGDAPTLVPQIAWSSAALLFAFVGWSLFAWGLWAQRRKLRSGHAPWTVPWLFLPPSVIGLGGLAGLNLYHPRYFSFAVAAFAVGLSQGLVAITKPVLIKLVSAFLIVLQLPIFASQREVYAKNGYDWSVVAAKVAQVRTEAGAEGIFYSAAPPTRTIATSFPNAFGGLRDITLSETPEEEGSLDGSDTSLSHGLLLQSPNRMIGLWSVRASTQKGDLTAFARAGYRISSWWQGPQTLVIVFTR